MARHVDVAVVGGGHSGMAASYLLKERGIEHVVLERSVPFHAWKNERWDSFTMQTPQWMNRLPGYPYWGDDPDAIVSKGVIVKYFDGYLDLFNPPLETGVEVTSAELRQSDGRFLVSTSRGPVEAKNLIVALGTYQKLKIPPFAEAIPSFVAQVPSIHYRNPASLPQGAVIVVGTGQSGCQIADDLIAAGREVYLSVGSCVGQPFGYCGRPMSYWRRTLGMNDERTADQFSPEVLAKERRACGSHSDKIKRSDFYLRRLARDGVQMIGRIVGAQGDRLLLGRDLDANIALAESADLSIKGRIDQFILDKGLGDPKRMHDSSLSELPRVPPQSIFDLDLRARNIGAIIWAVGYTIHLPWLRMPALDEDGFPLQTRGIAAIPGLYYMGLRWQHKVLSAGLNDCTEDATYVVEHLARRARAQVETKRRSS
jgi:putative flavoprotein involved in K+ transport